METILCALARSLAGFIRCRLRLVGDSELFEHFGAQFLAVHYPPLIVNY